MWKIRNQTEDIERQLRIQADRQIRDIQNVFQVPVANQTLFKQVDEYFKKLIGELFEEYILICIFSESNCYSLLLIIKDII